MYDPPETSWFPCDNNSCVGHQLWQHPIAGSRHEEVIFSPHAVQWEAAMPTFLVGSEADSSEQPGCEWLLSWVPSARSLLGWASYCWQQWPYCDRWPQQGQELLLKWLLLSIRCCCMTGCCSLSGCSSLISCCSLGRCSSSARHFLVGFSPIQPRTIWLARVILWIA